MQLAPIECFSHTYPVELILMCRSLSICLLRCVTDALAVRFKVSDAEVRVCVQKHLKDAKGRLNRVRIIYQTSDVINIVLTLGYTYIYRETSAVSKCNWYQCFSSPYISNISFNQMDRTNQVHH